MFSISSLESTIEKLRQSFAMFGLPKVLVFDNGTSFIEQEFQDFIQQNVLYTGEVLCITKHPMDLLKGPSDFKN